jgi:alpha-amylase
VDVRRTAFVHLFEWKWSDIARECEAYLGPKGFTAVQISPPNEHAWVTSGDGAPYPWWMRYQPVSYRLDSRSGTREELADMIRRCNAVGVAIYADAVINHMAPGAGKRTSAGESAWSARRFPRVPYDPGDFHWPCGITNYRDAHDVQNCDLLGLADLDTGEDDVRDKIADYLVELVELGVRGFRVDAAKHMSSTDLCAIVGRVESRTVVPPYWFLEVIGSPSEPIQPSHYFSISNGLADVTDFGYGRELFGKFAGGGVLAELRGFGEGLLPSERAVVFTDNHDKQRGHAGGGDYLTYHRGSLYELANVFMLAWPHGYPALMSSFAFTADTGFDASHGPPHDPATGATRGPWEMGGGAAPACFDRNRGGWVCEHRLRPIGNMVGFRAATMDAWHVTDWWDDTGNRIAFGRGSAGFVVINADGSPLSRTFQTSLPAGSYCDVISGDFGGGGGGTCTGTVVTVDAAGQAAITVPAMSAAAIHVGAKLGSST